MDNSGGNDFWQPRADSSSAGAQNPAQNSTNSAQISADDSSDNSQIVSNSAQNSSQIPAQNSAISDNSDNSDNSATFSQNTSGNSAEISQNPQISQNPENQIANQNSNQNFAENRNQNQNKNLQNLLKSEENSANQIAQNENQNQNSNENENQIENSENAQNLQTQIAQNSENRENSSENFAEIRWTASDSISHSRGKNWYVAAICLAILLVAAIFALWFFKILELFSAITTAILVVVILATIFVVAKKPSREINYILGEKGLQIDENLHDFAEFRAFGVRQNGALWQIVLLPVRRFGLATTVFINENQGEKIVDFLGARLPMEDVKNDVVDNLSRRLKL